MNPNPEDPTVPVSEQHQTARVPSSLREAFHGVAAHNGRTVSEELRAAMHCWVLLASTAGHHDPDVADALEPAILEGRLHDLTLKVRSHLGDHFPTAAPETVLATLARRPPIASGDESML